MEDYIVRATAEDGKVRAAAAITNLQNMLKKFSLSPLASVKISELSQLQF